jgi:7,8-dihydropterin-6-yl-methyl-4-(beta-D-ribofuranosyl)aminobenzene 5'-phosphate synthase
VYLYCLKFTFFSNTCVHNRFVVAGAADQDYIERTVTELAELKPDVVIPMHCSGADFIESMRRRMPELLVTTNVGTRFTFGV